MKIYSVYPSVCLSVYLGVCLQCLSKYLSKSVYGVSQHWPCSHASSEAFHSGKRAGKCDLSLSACRLRSVAATLTLDLILIRKKLKFLKFVGFKSASSPPQCHWSELQILKSRSSTSLPPNPGHLHFWKDSFDKTSWFSLKLSAILSASSLRIEFKVWIPNKWLLSKRLGWSSPALNGIGWQAHVVFERWRASNRLKGEKRWWSLRGWTRKATACANEPEPVWKDSILRILSSSAASVCVTPWHPIEGATDFII